MPSPKIVRPTELFPSKDVRPDKWVELESFIRDHWERALEGRRSQVDEYYERWTNNYKAIPRESQRSVPWPKSSNVVVPLIRIFVDTFTARTLNIIFATRPLFRADGYPRDVRESLQEYLNKKAVRDWQVYKVARALTHRGNKNGTVVVKTTWVEKKCYGKYESAVGELTDQEYIKADTSRPFVIPFDDFLVYPVTANDLEDVIIKFHRLRFVEEEVRRKIVEKKWTELSEENLESLLHYPSDVKRTTEQAASGIRDPYLREAHVVECYLEWELEPSRYYPIVATYAPSISKLVDLYFDPFSIHAPIFHDYRPYPQEDVFYGESLSQLLQGFQEESSCIHNDRRNASFMTSAPVFKRASGASIPNPSTNWYPGKVFDVDDMDDLEIVQFQGNYNPMIEEENWVKQMAEALTGIGPPMQGMAQGVTGKRGVYNTQGTLAILSESNQRQDTNIKDVRETLSSIGKSAFLLQRIFSASDSLIDTFPPKIQSQIRKALSMGAGPANDSSFEVKASSAGANKEVERQSLIQSAQVLSQYGAAVQQFTQALADPKLNQTIRMVLVDLANMQKWMAQRLLRAWDEYDAEGVLPDVIKAVEATVPGGGRGTTEPLDATAQEDVEFGGSSEPGTPLTREFLASISQMDVPAGGAGGEGSMAAYQ